jgi:hypothetical protein
VTITQRVVLGGSFVRFRLLGCLALASALLPAGAALAAPIGNYTMTFSVDGVGVVGSMTEVVDPDVSHTGYYSLDDVTLGDGTDDYVFVDYWNSQYDVDPFVTNNFNVTNISGAPQIFEIVVTVPVLPTGPQTLMTGSIGLTVTNTTSGGATLSDTGVAVYRAQIDGSTEQTLFDPAFSLSCAPPFCSDSDNAGFTNVLGPAAATDIAIRIRFSLSPGDSASGTSVFNIEAVPEPVTAVLIGLGLAGLAAAGQRRS